MNVPLTWVEAYIGLGSNLNHPIQQVLSAIRELDALDSIRQVAVSPLYSSRPVGPQDQPDYINAVIRIKTCLSPLELLAACQTLENRHGRKRLLRWGARTLDLDILLYDNQLIDLPELKVPHPELPNRAFVLYPLADIAPPDLLIPGNGRLVDLLAACAADGLQRIEQ